jgi:hypothetical protein
MQEEWRDIIGYEGYYQVSNFGNIKSLERIVKHSIGELATRKPMKKKFKRDRGGYDRVGLYKNGKEISFSVHRIVAQAFIPNFKNKPEVNHINEIKTDNRVENLEWCTRVENVNHGTKIKRFIASKSIPVIGVNIYSGIAIYYKSIKDTNKDSFINQNVWACCNGRKKTHKNYFWIYDKKE